MRMARQNGNAILRCTVPYANSLVVRGRYLEESETFFREKGIDELGNETNDPWHFMMEHESSKIVQVAV